MRWVGAALLILFILLILKDAFQTIMLPRRVTRPFRYTRLFYSESWLLWRAVAVRLPAGKRRAGFLSWFGPLSLLGLFTTWVIGLIAAFGFLHAMLETPVQTPHDQRSLETYLYLSGTTFFTLGFGDVVALNPFGRFLTVVEAGLGFVFLACVIAYLPVLYQAFSRREVSISLMDARAGSPPTAGQLLLRVARARNLHALAPLLLEWEHWAAELLESHISFPLLSYYRSQHDNQSWLGALTAILDSCALLIAGGSNVDPFQAQLTFAMGRHAVVDLAMVFRVPPQAPAVERFPCEQWRKLRAVLREAGLEMRDGPLVEAKLTELRAMYEPFVCALSQHFLFPLPPMFQEQTTVDNWQTSAWTRRTPGIEQLALPEGEDEHRE